MPNLNVIQFNSLESYNRIDPEYYQKKFFKILDNFEKSKSKNLIHYLSIRRDKFKKDGEKFNYIEISNIDTLTSALESSLLKTADAPSRAQYILKENDLIVSFVRPNRKAISIITSNEDNFVGTSGLGVYTSKGITPEYLLAYLKTNIINELISRKATASEYPAISNEDFLTTPIIIFSDILRDVQDLVQNTKISIKNYKSKYKKAEDILYDITGFKKEEMINKFKKISMDEILINHENRIDSKFYCIDLKYLNNHTDLNIFKIKDLIGKKIINGVSPQYDDDGDVVLVNSNHLGIYGLNFGATDRVTSDFYNKNPKAKINFEDVLVYATGAYFGRSNIYLEKCKSLAGLDTIIINFDKQKCDPYYAALYLNSTIGLTISEKFYSGSAQEHLYHHHLDEFPIFIPKNSKKVREISLLVKDSYNDKQKAFDSLSKAISKIETKLKQII